MYILCVGECACVFHVGVVASIVCLLADVCVACVGGCAGYFCVAGSTIATAAPCPPGQYSDAGAGACTACPSGRFGATTALSSSLCSGPCRSGYSCANGSVSDTANACPVGTFSDVGAAECSPCAPGRYGATSAMNTSVCSGLCSAGHFGAAANQTTALCDGPCTAGYYCVVGSTSSTAAVCPVGQYSLSGASACTPCSRGRFGASVGMNRSECSGACAAGTFGDADGQSVSSCSGNCSAGYTCAAGSVSPTSTPCPVGRYAPSGSWACVNCTAGYTCGVASPSATQTPCGPGQYSLSGSANCSACAGGYYCPVNACTTPTPQQWVCDVGFACPAGSISPWAVRCGSGYFCPAGSANATATRCDAGGVGWAAWSVSSTGVGTLVTPTARGLVVLTNYSGGVTGDCNSGLTRLSLPWVAAAAFGDVSGDEHEDIAVMDAVTGAVAVGVNNGSDVWVDTVPIPSNAPATNATTTAARIPLHELKQPASRDCQRPPTKAAPLQTRPITWFGSRTRVVARAQR